MVTTVREQPRAAVKHLTTWVQAVGLVYLIALGIVLLGITVALTARGAIELVSWMAGLVR